MGEVVVPVPSEGSPARTVSMTWGEDCDIQVRCVSHECFVRGGRCRAVVLVEWLLIWAVVVCPSVCWVTFFADLTVQHVCMPSTTLVVVHLVLINAFLRKQHTWIPLLSVAHQFAISTVRPSAHPGFILIVLRREIQVP